MGQFSLAMDSSQIATFISCPFKWKLSYVDHLKKHGAYVKALDKGSFMHYLLECYHKNYFYSKNFNEAQKYAIDKGRARVKKQEQLLEKWDLEPEEIDFLIQRFTQYLFFHQAGELETVEFNGGPGVELGFSRELVNNPDFYFVLEGKIDRLAKTKNGFSVFIDYKTQARRRDIYKHRIQFRNYALASGMSRGIIDIIGLQKDFKADNFKRELGYYPPGLMDKWSNEMIRIFYQAANCLMSDHYEQRWSECEGKYGYPCEYTDLCETVEPASFIQVKEAKYTQAQEWVPWTEED